MAERTAEEKQDFMERLTSMERTMLNTEMLNVAHNALRYYGGDNSRTIAERKAAVTVLLVIAADPELRDKRTSGSRMVWRAISRMNQTVQL